MFTFFMCQMAAMVQVMSQLRAEELRPDFEQTLIPYAAAAATARPASLLLSPHASAAAAGGGSGSSRERASSVVQNGMHLHGLFC